MHCDILLCMKVYTVGLVWVFRTFHFISMTGFCFIVLLGPLLWLLQKLFRAENYGPGTQFPLKQHQSVMTLDSHAHWHRGALWLAPL